MPVFIFISGFWSTGKVNFSRIKEYVIFYLIGNTFMMWFSFIFLGNEINLLEPYFNFWYLVALVVWRVCARYLKNIKGSLILSIIVGILIGFFQQINNNLALSRIICFLPFFIFGMDFNIKKMYNFVEKKKTICRILSAFMIAYIIYVSLGIISRIDFDELLMYPYTDYTKIINRIIIYVIAFLMIFVLLAITPDKKIFFFGKIGKNSLNIYIFHRINNKNN